MAVPLFLITVPLAAALRPIYQTVKLFSPWQSLWSMPFLSSWEEGNTWKLLALCWVVLLLCVFCALTHPVEHGWRLAMCSKLFPLELREEKATPREEKQLLS